MTHFQRNDFSISEQKKVLLVPSSVYMVGSFSDNLIFPKIAKMYLYLQFI